MVEPQVADSRRAPGSQDVTQPPRRPQMAPGAVTDFVSELKSIRRFTLLSHLDAVTSRGRVDDARPDP